MVHPPPRIQELQHPPSWRNSDRLRSRTPSAEQRRHRNWAAGSNPAYEYSMGMNLVMFTGKVTREPRLSGPDSNLAMVWFRIHVPNMDNPRQRLFVSVRTHGDLGRHVWENISLGDEVAVVGRLWTARFAGKHPHRQANFVAAERVSCSYPMQLDADPRFVRVRTDLWNRMTSVIEGMDASKVPEKQRLDLLRQFKKIMGVDATIDDEVQTDRLDPDPSSNKDLP